jgi:hypothetical protein
MRITVEIRRGIEGEVKSEKAKKTDFNNSPVQGPGPYTLDAECQVKDK